MKMQITATKIKTVTCPCCFIAFEIFNNNNNNNFISINTVHIALKVDVL